MTAIRITTLAKTYQRATDCYSRNERNHYVEPSGALFVIRAGIGEGFAPIQDEAHAVLMGDSSVGAVCALAKAFQSSVIMGRGHPARLLDLRRY